MTEQIDFGSLAPALAFVARLAELHPGLTAPSLTFSGIFPNRVSLCMDSAPEIEAWREALHIPTENVNFSVGADGQMRVGFDAEVSGIEFHAFARFATKQEEAAA
ncbi:hypothetical protein UK15_07935 [Streptomyces variegatus]|uniref:Uncharacterized protein n=1 Tax=Streptomyces variegatus TaxID=284040 RepID=A0A0M2GX85_9ACTN|nr:MULTISPECIES: hypothetical protein [Streptomyces]KJK40263.1 hypothetical protein UK15_07935 [Streptomyces variegatus]